MNRAALLFAVVGMASGSLAQRNAIDVRVRLAGESVWTDSVSVLGTNSAQVEVAIFYERATGYGFGSSVHNVVVSDWHGLWGDHVTLLDRPDSAQHPDGRQGRFNFGVQRQAAYTEGPDTGRMRISAPNNTQNNIAGGINVQQRRPDDAGTTFDTGNPVMGFRFDLDLTTPLPDRTYTISTPLADVLWFRVYETFSSVTQTAIPLDQVVMDGAQIYFAIPGPGVMAVAGFGVVGGMRRRR